jgi:hypothetical protein
MTTTFVVIAINDDPRLIGNAAHRAPVIAPVATHNELNI